MFRGRTTLLRVAPAALVSRSRQAAPRNTARAPEAPYRYRKHTMTRLIVVRLFFGALTLWAVSLVVFAATQALPGDAAQLILGRDATPERLEALRNQLNLHEPVAVQYMQWLQGLLLGDLGTSFSNRMPVAEYLASPVRSSLTLMGLAALVATPIALVVGGGGGPRGGWAPPPPTTR
jgi:ABC-type dipeptide/oligopeptide/nickel transport system permease component